jgi:hypothetical protein
MAKAEWLQGTSPAFRLMIATSWLAPDPWRLNQEEAVREAVGAGPDWAEYLRLVDRHRIPALSWAALKRVPGLAIPESARKGLQERSDACRMQAVRHSLLLAKVLKAFNQAEISVMPFKGPILSAELYGDVSLRQCKDLDIAVPPEDIARAQACLENLGWRPEISNRSLTPRQLESFWRFESNLVFVRSVEGSHLELHWRHEWETPDQTDARWARCIPSVWQGCSHLAMNPIDQVLYLCSHGGRHAWFRAKWLGDLACIHVQGRVNWETALDEARSTGQERPLLAGLRLLKEVHGLSLPDLPGNPYKNLPSFLIDNPLRALQVVQEPGDGGVLDLLHETLRWNIHDLLALPQKSWRETLARRFYFPSDYEVVRLPDYLFWAYTPLRPVLWAWRGLSHIRAR